MSEPTVRRVNIVADVTIRVEFEADQHRYEDTDVWEHPSLVVNSYMVDGLKTFLKDHAPTALHNGEYRVTVQSCEPIEGTSS